MKHSLGLATLLGLGLLAMAPSTQAADWYHGPDTQRFAGDPVTASRAFLMSRAAQLQLPQLELSHRTTLPLRQLHTVRFEQRYHGLPVIGKAVAVRIAADGAVRTAFVDVAKNLSVSVVPAIDGAAAVSRVEALVGRSMPGAEASLAVLPQEDTGGILVWRVGVATPKGAYEYVVDANTAGVLYQHPLAMDALGRVYDVNWVKTPDPADRELTPLVAGTPQRLVGLDGQMAVYGYVSGDVSSNFVTAQDTGPSAGEDFLYDPSADVESLNDPFGEVNAFYHCGRMHDYFTTKHGVDMSGSAWSLSIVTSYAPASAPEYIDNAFFTPGGYGTTVPGARKNLIAIGRGSVYDFAYDSDVFLHEYTHYVNHNAVNFSNGPFDFDEYGLVVMPGALDEGTADYFSSTINDDPVVGEATLDYYSRDLSAPGGHCPDTMIGESHEDGKLIGTAAWAVREALGTELGDQVVWGAVSLLTQSASLGDFGRGMVSTAQDLGLSSSQIDQINSILADRGLDNCDRTQALQEGKPMSTIMGGLDYVGYMFGASCSQVKNYGIELTSMFQFKFTPAADAKGIKLDTHLMDLSGGGALDWAIYARKGSMVRFSSGGNQMTPTPSTYDYVLNNQTAENGSLTIDASSDPPFDPTADYYFIVVHQNCPDEEATLVGSSVMDLPTDAGADSASEPDAAGADGGAETDSGEDALADAGSSTSADAGGPPAATGSDDDGGCGCSTPSHGGSAGAGALLALGLAVAARRRRNRA